MASSNLPAAQEEASVPSFLEKRRGYTGAEDIDKKDISIPRIKIAQAVSQEVTGGDLDEGDLFLNITGQLLAKAGEPMRFTPIAISKEYILWRDRQFEGGGIFARAKKTDKGYAWDKPNQIFKNKIKGALAVEWVTGTIVGEDDNLDAWGSEIPGDPDSKIAATEHHNFVVSLPDHGNMIAALSLSRTQTTRARDLNAMIRMNQYPMYSRLFWAFTETQTKGADSWANIRFKPAGYVEDEPLVEMLEGMHEHYIGQGFNVDQSNEGEEATENF